MKKKKKIEIKKDTKQEEKTIMIIKNRVSFRDSSKNRRNFRMNARAEPRSLPFCQAVRNRARGKV